MKHIVILGSGAGWHHCPFEEYGKDVEVWGIAKMLMNKKFQEMEHARIDKLFNMDDIMHMQSFDPNSPHKVPYTLDYFIEVINKSKAELITSYEYPELDNVKAFPLKKIVELFGVFYYTNTICFMLAYALWLDDVDKITFWGINQTGSIEYLRERRGVEFWIGLVTGMGIELHIEGPSALLKPDRKLLYGYNRTQHELKEEFNIDIDL